MPVIWWEKAILPHSATICINGFNRINQDLRWKFLDFERDGNFYVAFYARLDFDKDQSN